MEEAKGGLCCPWGLEGRQWHLLCVAGWGLGKGVAGGWLLLGPVASDGPELVGHPLLGTRDR